MQEFVKKEGGESTKNKLRPLELYTFGCRDTQSFLKRWLIKKWIIVILIITIINSLKDISYKPKHSMFTQLVKWFKWYLWLIAFKAVMHFILTLPSLNTSLGAMKENDL